MAIHLGKDDDRCKLMIDGRFTFDTYREFLCHTGSEQVVQPPNN